MDDNPDKDPDSRSPDGRFILYSAIAPRNYHLWVLPLSGDQKPFPFLKTPFNERSGQFSPDGHWVAYQSDESDKTEVYVTPFPGPGGKWQISTAGGEYPRWRRDGSEIFYLATDGRMMAAAVNGKGSNFEVGVVKPLFEMRAVRPNIYPYDVSSDGQHFLIITTPEQAATSEPITVVLNWQAELKKK